MLLYRSNLDIIKITCDQMSTLEQLQIKLRHQNENIHVVLLCRSPTNSDKGLTLNKFNAEFNDVVNSVILERGQLLSLGDSHAPWICLKLLTL